MDADVPEVSRSECDDTGDECYISLALEVVTIPWRWDDFRGLRKVHGWACGVAFHAVAKGK